MKENIDRGLISDEDSEGGEEPDLIANHPVGDMVDRQYKEIADAHIDISDNKEIENNCVMNQTHLLDSKFTYITCNCIACPELGDNICYECIKTCHAGHNTDGRNIIQKAVNITQYCSCAECGHKRKEIKVKQEVLLDEKITCQMLKLIGKENFNTFYVDRAKNKFYCPFCRRNCGGEGNTRSMPISVSKLRKEEFHCSCKEKKFHSRKCDDVTRLLKLFMDKRIDNDICVAKIIGNLINNGLFENIFLDDIKVIFEDLKKTLLMDRKMRQNMTKNRYLTDKYLNCVKLLKIFYQNLIVNNAFELNAKDIDFSEVFNFNFISELFELFAKYRKEMSQSELSHSNDTSIIQIKTDCLFFYRTFIILPKASPFKRYGILSDTENSTPLNRLIAKKHFDEFLADLGLEKPRFTEFIKNIWKTIERYDDHLVEYDLTEKLNAELINEYFEILIILSALRYTKAEDINDFYHNIVIESFNSVVKMAKKYKIDNKNLKKRIEEFIKYTFLNYNDEIFYREIISNSKKAQTNSNTVISLLQKRLSRLRPPTDRTNLINNNMNDSNSNIILNDNMTDLKQSKLNLEFIEEEKNAKDNENESNEFSDANFIFESNAVSNALINSLFAFKKATNDYAPEFQKWEIYDWLASEDDFYIESIKSFYDSYGELDIDNRLLIMHFRAFCKSCKELENSSIVDKNQNSMRKIIKTNKDMNEIFYNYFQNGDKPDAFCDKIKEKIDSMCKTFKNVFYEKESDEVNNSIDLNINNESIVDKKIFQLYLVKFGILDDIYKIYYQFHKNNFLAKLLPGKKEEELVTSIFEFLSLISEDNILISYILFSNQSLDLFLSMNNKYSNLNSRIKFIELKYYLKWLKNLYHKKEKLNLIMFITKLKELYAYLEDLLTKNIGDKSFKLTQEQEKLGLNAAKAVKTTLAKMLLRVKDSVIEERSEYAKSENAMKSRHDAGKMKEEKMKLKKIEMLNKKIMDKLKSEGECYFNLDINFTSDDLIEKITCIVTCLKKCCKLSTNKSLLILNNLILDIIYKLYKSPFYYQIWEKYRKSFNESLIDEDGSRFGRATKEVINQKLNDYKQASLIDTSNKITEKEHGLVINIYKLLYNIDDYSFYLITDEIPKFEIKSLLQEKIDSMSFIDRKTLSSVYMRYYFISPFNILSNLNRINMNSMTKLPDCNINGAIISTSKEELKKESININKTYSKKKTKESKYELFISNVQNKKEEKEVKNASQDRAFKFLKRYRIVEQALGLEPLFTNLIKYRRLTQKYLDKDIVPKPYLFLKYFKNIILYPTVYSLYKLLYFTPVMTLHYKYYVYKITFLFFQCLKYFFDIVLQNNDRFLQNEKYKNIFTNMIYTETEKSDEKIREIEDIIKSIVSSLDDLIIKIDKDPKFKPLDTPQLLEYLCDYLKYFTCLNFLPLQFNGKKFRNETQEKETESQKDLLVAKNSLLAAKISNFISVYEKLKNDGIENKNNSLINVFAEATGEEEPEKHQLKINIILDLMFRMNFKHNKKLSIYARGKDNSFILVNIINKIYKTDPDLWHDCLVDISSMTKHILYDIISNQLTFLIQHIYIDFHKLKNLSDNREGLNTSLSAKNKFLIIIEFLRLFCENHHKIYQTILIHSNINKFLLKNMEESLDLLDFILKIPTLSKNSIIYLNSKSNFASIFKHININNYFDELILGLTDFLIEIIQGSFESNMHYFDLPSNESSDFDKQEEIKESAQEKQENEIIKKGSIFLNSIKDDNNNKKFEKKEEGNIDFEKYIETGYYCLDDLKNENDKYCLAQFLRFVNCFLEEPFNPKENKERMIRMFNPKKMLTGLAECTVDLYKEYREVLNKKKLTEESNNNNKNNNNKEEIPEKFSEDLINLYLTSSDLGENLNFIISSNIFRFLLISSQYKIAEKARRYLKNIKMECEEDKPIKAKKNKNEIIGRREAYRFFSKIVKDVEIFYKPKDNLTEQERKKFREFFTLEQYKEIEENFQNLFDQKGDVQKVVFFIDPASLFTKENDLNNFIGTSPGDKNERLDYLLGYMPTFKDSLLIRRKLWKKQNKLLNNLYNINYREAIFASTFLSIFINLMVLKSSFYINKNETNNTNIATPRTLLEEKYSLLDENNYINYYDIYEKMKNRTNIIYSMQSFLEEPGGETEEKTDGQTPEDTTETTKEEEESTNGGENDNEIEEEKEIPVWIRQELNTQIIVFLTIINIIFIFFLMSNWFYFEILKYEKEDGEEEEGNNGENGDNDDDVNIAEEKNKEEFSILNTFQKFYNSDIQNLMWNLLLSVVAILSVDFHFLYSVQLFTLFFLIKSMYTLIYSVQIRYAQFCTIGFMFLLTSLFFSMIKYRWFTDKETCKTYSECFFDMLNSGIRGGAGMGFGIKKIGQQGYYIEFLLEMIIFILVSLVLFNIITGIIVDSFQKLKDQESEENEMKENTCYICSLHREKFEKKGIKFENHTEQEHNIINYFNYIYKVEMTDESDLNSLDYQVMQSIKNRRTDFFPIKTCLSLSSNKK